LIRFTEPEGIRDNLERAAKFSCYALVNKLVFYEAMMKRYGAQLHKLTAPEHIEGGDDLRLHLEKFFADAKEITGDYETVFGEDHTNVGSRIPFYSNFVSPYWRSLIGQIHEFDFSQLDYEVIGNIFERLISPEERHKYGQFYTRVEVVDLINSFCIPTGTESVMDPACGGGTFLVRAYARKRELAPGRSHEQLLSELYGVPLDPRECGILKQRYERLVRDRTQRFRELTADRVGDPELQEEVFQNLTDLVGHNS
jgi:type I restriction-modification system DNA methylase subunit